MLAGLIYEHYEHNILNFDVFSDLLGLGRGKPSTGNQWLGFRICVVLNPRSRIEHLLAVLP